MKIELRNHIELPPSGNADEAFGPYIETFLLESTREPLGGVLVLPGGGYSHRANHEGNPVAEKFNALGYHAFVLQYRVAPYRYPDPQRDLVRAVKLIRSHADQWYLDKLAVLGFSAGGHLAASGTILADKINADEGDAADAFCGRADAMILCYPVIAITESFAHCGSGINLCGGDEARQKMTLLDMHRQIDQNTPPAFLWHTATDQLVDVKNSMEFASKMWQCGKTCELHVFPRGPHGRGLGLGIKNIKIWAELAAEFLENSAGFNRG